MTEASIYLTGLARRIAATYLELTRPDAILLTGSAALGESDYFSDLDLILYYDGALPAEETLRVAHARCEGLDAHALGPRTTEEYAETYQVRGVECQLAYITVAAWERQMASVRERLEVASPLQKALSGLLEGTPLHGDALIHAWQARAAEYPDALALAMVRHYLTFFPLWSLGERVATRDATIWTYQVLVEAAQHLLGVLAGLNRLYYTPFQLKRTRGLISRMAIQPERLAERLESLFAGDLAAAGAELERLVGEVAALVERHLPNVETAAAQRWLGTRQQPWRPVS